MDFALDEEDDLVSAMARQTPADRGKTAARQQQASW